MIPPAPKRRPRQQPAAATPANKTPLSQEKATTPNLLVVTDSTEPGVPQWQRILGVLGLVVMMGCAYWFMVEKPNREWTPGYAVDLTIHRKLPEVTPAPSLDSIFTREVESSIIDEGNGVRVNWTREESKKTTKGTEIFLEPQPDTNAGLRREEYNIAKAKLQTWLEQFNAKAEPKIFRDLVFVDNTEGIGPQLRKQMAIRFDPSDVGKIIKNGDGLQIIFHRLTDSPAYQAEPVIDIPPGSPPDAKQAEIEKSIRSILATASTNYSALATGLFNALEEDGTDENTRILLFSDLLENFPATTVFHPDVPRALSLSQMEDRKNWENIHRLLQRLKECPKLNGAEVHITLPNNPARMNRMIAAFNIWKDLFLAKGASKVEMHF